MSPPRLSREVDISCSSQFAPRLPVILPSQVLVWVVATANSLVAADSAVAAADSAVASDSGLSAADSAVAPDSAIGATCASSPADDPAIAATCALSAADDSARSAAAATAVLSRSRFCVLSRLRLRVLCLWLRLWLRMGCMAAVAGRGRDAQGQ